MKITFEDLKFEDLDDGEGWGPDLRRILREAIEDECRKVARTVAKELFDEKTAEIVADMRSWLASMTPAERQSV